MPISNLLCTCIYIFFCSTSNGVNTQFKILLFYRLNENANTSFSGAVISSSYSNIDNITNSLIEV